LKLIGILEGIDEGYLENKVVGLPNAHLPSDHISIAAEFRFLTNGPVGKEDGKK